MFPKQFRDTLDQQPSMPIQELRFLWPAGPLLCRPTAAANTSTFEEETSQQTHCRGGDTFLKPF
jgi:hypothetical protein